MDTSSNTVCFALEDIGREDEVRGPGHSCLKRGNGYDYVFFDWKGTLAKKSGLNTRQRTEIRLRHFYNALKDLMGGPRETSVSIRSGDLSDSEDDCIANGNKAELEPKPVAGEGVKLPTFEELEALFERLMKEHKGEDGTKTFSWHSFLHALLRELGLAQLNAHEKHLLVTAFQGSGSVDSGLHPGAEEIVRWLREDAGLRLGLIRNSKLNEQAMRNRIAKAGIDPDHFESVVMGGEVGFAKPDAEVFITAAKTANIESVHSTDPKRILYIGNEVIADVHGANGVGWTSVLVTHTEPSSGGLADFEIDHLLQLKDIVLRSRDDTEERLY